MRDRLLNAALIVVTFCALVTTALGLERRFSPRPPPQRLYDQQQAVFIEGWDTLAMAGHRIGPDSADVTVVVFSDFECPMCATFATRTYPEFEKKHAGRTRLVYRHWPLTRHRFARPAAAAAECAAAQGRFRQFHDTLYAQQQLLGLKSLGEFAEEAGVPNLDVFANCIASDTTAATIDRDIATVRRIGGQGTPTVLVNGWLFAGGLGAQRLDSIARQYLTPPGISPHE